MLNQLESELEEFEGEINNGDALRAQGWQEYVGQQALKKRLRIHIQSARVGGRMLPHVLLSGPPGYGKTTLAQIIARELNDDFKMLKMAKNMTVKVLEDILRSWEGGILFLDEIHNASTAFQHELLTLTEDGFITLKNGRRLEHKAITVIGATTEPESLLAPLLDRFTIQPYFDTYSDEEMTDILLGMAEKVNVELDEKLAMGLARATGGTPRLAKKFVLAVRSLKDCEIEPTVEDVLDLEDIDEDGLVRGHMAILTVLDELGGSAGLDKITNMTRLHMSTINHLERLLVKRGFISYTEKGREITQAGARKLNGTKPQARTFRKVAA